MRLLSLILLCLLTACSDMFLPPAAITDFRIVGAKVEVQGDPARANPSPGDDVQVSILAIDQGIPEADASGEPTLTPGLLQWELVPCVPLPVTLGVPLCGPPITPCEGCEATPPQDPLATPIVRFAVPPQDLLDAAGASSVLLQGVVCSNGTPTSRDAILRFLTGETDELEPCEPEPVQADRPVEGRFVTITIPIEDDPSDPNLNPELLSIILNGQNGEPWPPPYDQGVPRDAPGTACAADLADLSEEQQMAQPRAGDEPSTINLSVTSDSLQSYTVDDMELTEEIQVSWLADGGAYQTSFSFITDPATSVLTNWQPPTSVPEGGELVRFTFVIRDGRGGTDWAERGLCILPPEQAASPP